MSVMAIVYVDYHHSEVVANYINTNEISSKSIRLNPYTAITQAGTNVDESHWLDS